jgi:hypothetical protein
METNNDTIPDIACLNGTCFGDVIELAEVLGWQDPNLLPWTPSNADATEESAIEFLLTKGYYYNEN